VDLFNLLNHSVAAGDSPDYLAALLEELINCTAWHFSHEERLMMKYGYKGYAEHRLEHQDLIKSVRQLQTDILGKGTLDASADLEFLERWLTGHILSNDMRLGAYLAEVM
jgi:hemerythrin